MKMSMLFLICSIVLLHAEGDTLIAHFRDSLPEIGSDVAYLTPSGDTVISYGKYRYYSTDTITQYGIVIKEGEGFIALNPQGNKLYHICTYDNGPDYPSHGLFRIRKELLVGFADSKTGTIKIEPQYSCAEPFRQGKAKVSYGCFPNSDSEHLMWIMDHPFYIDTGGTVVQE